ncbi:ATP-binding protein [Streptomyces sp. ISL-43]|uniref:ATP-binding protein n=1 Tax=Streptomyces sp. ISL-43 TaxID=2819183 RepID=UPI001BE64367|nr:ATP-binding protein [Streptomyces sp. ISL-43]MBT2445916.1 ATP-binding protein [Streptomyces sp. ISL-43]
MNIDPAQPWGIAIDYAGRATLTEAGHSIQVRVYDAGLGGTLELDPVSGYPSVYVTAQFTETGDLGTQLRGSGQVVLDPPPEGPVTPDRTAVASAVAAALADFEARTAAYAALCATYSPVGV